MFFGKIIAYSGDDPDLQSFIDLVEYNSYLKSVSSYTVISPLPSGQCFPSPPLQGGTGGYLPPWICDRRVSPPLGGTEIWRNVGGGFSYFPRKAFKNWRKMVFTKGKSAERRLRRAKTYFSSIYVPKSISPPSGPHFGVLSPLELSPLGWEARKNTDYLHFLETSVRKFWVFKKKAKKYGKNIRENLWKFAQKNFEPVAEVGGLLELCHLFSCCAVFW